MDKNNINEYILPCHFLASVETYALYYSGHCIWEAHENYQKRSMRNRARFNSDQGPVHFSVPLKAGKNNQLPIQDVQISYAEDWIKSLLHLLRTNYGSTPYFEHYFPEFSSKLTNPPNHLWDLNFSLHEWLSAKLDIRQSFNKTSSWAKEIDGNRQDFRYTFKFKKNTKDYPQIHNMGKGFTNNLSVLDLLFNCGPESHLYLSDPFK